MAEFVGDPYATTRLRNLMNPAKPIMSGVVQNQDAYMKGKVAQRAFYAPMLGNLKKNMEEYYRLTGRRLDVIESYRMEDAEYAIVGMGSFMETAKTTVDWLRQVRGEKVGVLSVLSYRPFPTFEIIQALKNVKAISVLERLDESSAPENPLARDIKAAFADALWGNSALPKINRLPLIQHGAGGLGGRDVRGRDFIAIVDNLKLGEGGKTRYCVGIPHPDSLGWPEKDTKEAEPDIRTPGSFSVRGHSVGGYGSVTTNKVIASVCGDLFNVHVQAFPKYGAEKKGLPTTYFLTLSPKPIRFHQELAKVDLVFLNDMGDFLKAKPLEGLTDEGLLIVQSPHKNVSEVWQSIPAQAAKEEIQKRRIRVFSVDAQAIAKQVVSTQDLVQRMQGIVLLGVFLKVTPFALSQGMNREQLLESVEKVLRKYFGKRGEKVVMDNLICVKRGYEEIFEIPPKFMV